MLHTALIGFLIGSILILVFLERRCASLPPDPKPLPLLGDVLQLREKHIWKLATDWCEEHGAFDYDCEFLADREFIFSRVRPCEFHQHSDVSQRVSGE